MVRCESYLKLLTAVKDVLGGRRRRGGRGRRGRSSKAMEFTDFAASH
jgi:hypothetical protein